MSFYIRKSFRAGPIRLNLSKSGLGLSAGVTGARVGMNARGQAYVHGGRHGLYYRENLGSKSRSRSESGSGEQPGSPSRGSSGASATQEHFVDTGATYPAQGGYTAPSFADDLWPRRSSGRAALLFSMGTLAWLATWLGRINGLSLLAAAAGGVLAFGCYALAMHDWRRAKKRRSLHDGLIDGALAEGVRGPEHRADVARLVASELVAKEVQAIGVEVYRALATDAIHDQLVDRKESEALRWVQSVCSLDAEFVQQARLEAFRAAFLTMIADQELDAEEQERFEKLRAELGLSDIEARPEREAAERLREIRELREGTMPVVETAHKLQKDEACHFESEGRILKSKVLKRFSRQRVKHVVRGFELDKEGTLLITSKRVMLRHAGTTAYKWDEIVGLELDLDQNLLILSRDGVQRPTYISTPGAPKAAAIVSVLAGV